MRLEYFRHWGFGRRYFEKAKIFPDLPKFFLIWADASVTEAFPDARRQQ